MSQIAKKHLLAGIIFGDAETGEYIYLPGGEVGTDQPLCVFEHDGQKEDVDLDRAGYLVDHLTLKQCSHPTLGKRSVGWEEPLPRFRLPCEGELAPQASEGFSSKKG